MASSAKKILAEHGWIAILILELGLVAIGLRYWMSEREANADLTIPPNPRVGELPSLHFPMQLDLELHVNDDLSAEAIQAADHAFRVYADSPELNENFLRFTSDFSPEMWPHYWLRYHKFQIARSAPSSVPMSQAPSIIQMRSQVILSEIPPELQASLEGFSQSQELSAPAGFNLPVLISIPYSGLQALLTEQLTGSQAIEQGDKQLPPISIDAFTVFPSDRKIVVGVHFASPGASPSRGWIYFTATPAFEPTDQTLRLQHLSLTPPTGGNSSAVPGLIAHRIEDAIQNAAVVQVAELHSTALTSANRLLDVVFAPALLDAFEAPLWQLKEPAPPIALPAGVEGVLTKISSYRVYVTDQELVLVSVASGKVTLMFETDVPLANKLATEAAEAERREKLRQRKIAQEREYRRVLRALRKNSRHLNRH